MIVESLVAGRVQEAIDLTLASKNPYSTYKYVRRQIYTNNRNRRPDYLQRVRHFQHVHFSPQDPEWGLLNDLLEGSLHTQYRVETSRKPFLGKLDSELRSIRSLPEAFYDYEIPDCAKELGKEREREAREVKHMRPVNIGNLQMILSRAKSWRSWSHPWDWVACASILCGRRTQEILWSLEWERRSDYVIGVKGLLKQWKGAGDIPLLVPYEDFAELMGKIREHQYPTESTTHRLKPAFVRVFGEWFNHSERRNIYCEAAFRCREESGFYPTVSKVMWFDLALCHDTNVIHQGTNLTYQTLTFENGRGALGT